MTLFQLTTPRNHSVWSIYRTRDRIEMDPVYQREGEIWGPDKRQLLIDTIINGFDVPKIYLHKFVEPKEGSKGEVWDFAVVDGKQRLSTLWDFIDGKFALSDDFIYLKDEKLDLRGLTYSELAKKYPDIKQDFDSWALDIVAIETDDLEVIEDLFSRLNEAMPLNAAEKRNAYRGPLPGVVRDLAGHKFFKHKVPFANSRYRHYDIVAKMLLASHLNSVVDTKKAYVDGFFRDSRKMTAAKAAALKSEVTHILDFMAKVFIDCDPLLRQVGMNMIYYHVFRRANAVAQIPLVTRKVLLAFEDERADNKKIAAEDITLADYDLLEFNRYTQWPNDAIAMRFRLGVMDERLFGSKLGYA